MYGGVRRFVFCRPLDWHWPLATGHWSLNIFWFFVDARNKLNALVNPPLLLSGHSLDHRTRARFLYFNLPVAAPSKIAT
jgi:hypothetical protein